MKTDFKKMPVGPDHSMEKKLAWAHRLFETYSTRMLSDDTISSLMKDYKESIRNNWNVMAESGVVDECTECAVHDGGSCCGSGIEHKFDVVNLLINLLLGVRLPSRPWDPAGCWFLGEKGCLIIARHVICVNFICRRLYDRISPENIRRVQRAMQEETERAFVLEEYIKGWLGTHG